MLVAERELAGLLARWWIYQRERFPLAQYGPLVAAITWATLSYDALLRGRADPVCPGVHMAAFLSALLCFFQLRVADEFKDAEEDLRYRPSRPVPRGLVSLRELGGLALVAAALQLALALRNGYSLVPLLAVVWVYGLLLWRELFIPRWLRAHTMLSLALHLAIVPLIVLYVSAFDWSLGGAVPEPGLGWLVAASLGSAAALEFGRKIRAPSDELPGVSSYSLLWGRRRAVVAWLSVLSATSVALVVAASLAGLAVPLTLVLTLLLAVAIRAGVWFARCPTTAAASDIERITGLWILGTYLGLGGLLAWSA